MYAKVADSFHQLASLHSITNYLNQSPIDINLLFRLSYQTLNLLGADVVTIYEYIANQDRFITPPQIAGRLIDQKKMYTEIKTNDAPNLLLESENDVFSNDVSKNEILNNPKRKTAPSRKTFVKREKIKSAAGVRLKSGHEIVGVMFINYRRAHEFAADERQLIELLANAAGIAIKNRRMLAVIDTLNDIDREVRNKVNFDEMLESFMRFIKRILPADRCEIRQFDPFNEDLSILACFPKDGLVENASRIIDKYHGVTGWVAQQGKSRIVKDVEKDPLYKACDSKVKSELCVPLKDYDDRVIGLINVESFKINAFSQLDQMMLEAVASRVVTAIKNEERQRNLCALESIAVLGDLAGPLAHALRNEMGGIKFYAENIQSNNECNEEILEAASEICSCANRMLYWVNKFAIWDVSDKIRPVYFDDVICETIKDIPPRINKSLDIKEDLPPLHSGEDQLKLLFVNLFQNAADAMPQGGSLKVEVDEYQLYNKPWIICRILDNGTGISEEDLPNIFSPNYSTKNKELHMGFGLWWCKNYIERIGAKIQIKSKLGEGTVVELKFPVFLAHSS
jgi:signal transduction histidine kinase